MEKYYGMSCSPNPFYADVVVDSCGEWTVNSGGMYLAMAKYLFALRKCHVSAILPLIKSNFLMMDCPQAFYVFKDKHIISRL